MKIYCQTCSDEIIEMKPREDNKDVFECPVCGHQILVKMNWPLSSEVFPKKKVFKISGIVNLLEEAET